MVTEPTNATLQGEEVENDTDQLRLILQAKRVLAPFLDTFLEAQAEGVRDRQGRTISVLDGRADHGYGIMLITAGFLDQAGQDDGVRADLIYFRDGTHEGPAEVVGIRFWRSNATLYEVGVYGSWGWAKNCIGLYEDDIIGPEIALYSPNSTDLAAMDVVAVLYEAVDAETTRVMADSSDNRLTNALDTAEEEISATILRLSLLYGFETSTFLGHIANRIQSKL